MEFTHFNDEGRAKMIDVGQKKDTKRTATAKGYIKMNPQTLDMILKNRSKKGDVLAVAQVAGIMAAKNTYNIIPMCHNIPLTGIDISFKIYEDISTIGVKSRISTFGKTGAEMEALTAASVACLTIYDMCKAVDKGMIIQNVQLLKKSGGKSKNFTREEILPWER